MMINNNMLYQNSSNELMQAKIINLKSPKKNLR